MPKCADREYRDIDVRNLEVRTLEDGQDVFEGYATTFNQPYRLCGDEQITVNEQIDRGAFAETDMSDVIMQYDHQGRVFARMSNGTLQLSQDDHGLKILADLEKAINELNLTMAVNTLPDVDYEESWKAITSAAAKLTGIGDRVGSLEVGKKADLIVIDPKGPSMMPVNDKIASLVTAMHSNNIQSTMCNGKWLMRDRVILTLDEEAILKEACARGAAIYDRAGIVLPDRFPVVKV